jgi:hypothetical protein
VGCGRGVQDENRGFRIGKEGVHGMQKCCVRSESGETSFMLMLLVTCRLRCQMRRSQHQWC